MKARHRFLARGRKDDVLLAEDSARGHQNARAALRQQGADDVQRIGQHLAAEPGEMRTHLQRGRAAVEHDPLARLAQRRRRAADGLLGDEVAGDRLVEGRAGKLERPLGQPRPAMHPDDMPGAFQPRQIAPDGGRRGGQVRLEIAIGDEAGRPHRAQDQCFAFGGMHAVNLPGARPRAVRATCLRCAVPRSCQLPRWRPGSRPGSRRVW